VEGLQPQGFQDSVQSRESGCVGFEANAEVLMRPWHCHSHLMLLQSQLCDHPACIVENPYLLSLIQYNNSPGTFIGNEVQLLMGRRHASLHDAMMRAM